MPRPPSPGIDLTEKQIALLQRICRRQRSTQQQVRRASIILKIAEGRSNKEVAELLAVHRITVRTWRERWLIAAGGLLELEHEESETLVRNAIETVLSDAYRSGTPPSFSSEQVVQIIALACEAPIDSGLPLSHWTPKALADEALKRKIVASISEQSVARFLKGSGPKATAVALLADQRTRQRP